MGSAEIAFDQPLHLPCGIARNPGQIARVRVEGRPEPSAHRDDQFKVARVQRLQVADNEIADGLRAVRSGSWFRCDRLPATAPRACRIPRPAPMPQAAAGRDCSPACSPVNAAQPNGVSAAPKAWNGPSTTIGVARDSGVSRPDRVIGDQRSPVGEMNLARAVREQADFWPIAAGWISRITGSSQRKW